MSAWAAEGDRWLLVELIHHGTVRRRGGQAAAWDRLEALPWTRRTPRKGELVLDPAHADDLRALLDRAWPAWRAGLAALVAEGLPARPDGWRILADRQRERASPELTGQVNRRTAAAMVAPHAKATLTAQREAALGAAAITHDGLIRMRPHAGLTVRRGEVSWDGDALEALLGELTVTERALREGTEVGGKRPTGVVLVENLGAYIDLARPTAGWLVVHVPGWDVRAAEAVLAWWPRRPAVLFGDLDPNGARIRARLRQARPDLRWCVPAWWSEYRERHALPKAWPAGTPLEGAPALVRELAAAGEWLEQEAVVFDPRLPQAMAEAADL